MSEKEILLNIKNKVFDLLKKDSTGHDFFHIQRVVNNVNTICLAENINPFYPTLLAYLHDVGDYKIHNGIDKTDVIVTEILQDIFTDKNYINKIVKDIHLIGYKGGMNKPTNDINIWIVQDADKLDAIGAIGIARAFAYGGSKGRLLHNPNHESVQYNSIEDYQKSNAPTIQHFYDKLLKLKDLIKTNKGKELAEERHQFMLNFLNQFYKEWGNSPDSTGNPFG